MKNKELTFITAFFDIGRSDFKSLPRSNDNYFEYFKFWACTKNNIVVYTDSNMARKVEEFRTEIGLKNKTKIIIIDDISNINNELNTILKRMKKIELSQEFLSFRYNEFAPENKALYNYVMLLKSWCLKDAVDKGYASGEIAWLDFGFNHGGRVYTNCDDFNRIFNYNSKNKIVYFSLKDDDDKSILKIVQELDVYIMGFYFALNDKLVNELYELELEAMNSLLDVGLMDDDQTIMLMAKRKRPDLFNVIKSDWLMPIKQSFKGKFEIRQKELKYSFKDKLLFRYRVKKRNKNYLKRFKNSYLKNYLD